MEIIYSKALQDTLSKIYRQMDMMSHRYDDVNNTINILEINSREYFKLILNGLPLDKQKEIISRICNGMLFGGNAAIKLIQTSHMVYVANPKLIINILNSICVLMIESPAELIEVDIVYDDALNNSLNEIAFRSKEYFLYILRRLPTNKQKEYLERICSNIRHGGYVAIGLNMNNINGIRT